MNPAPATIAEPVMLRLRGAGDEQFLFQVYASTRQEELAQVDWNEPQKQTFLEMQFRAQSRYYESEYPGAEFQIILSDGQPAGRLYVHRRQDEIRIMDIALLPVFRGRGMGTQLLKEILTEGARTNRRVTVHVEFFNRARRLYERLGFRHLGGNGVYVLLERKPAGAPGNPTRHP